MTRIVFLDRGTIGPSVSMSRPAFAHEWIEFERTAPTQVVERLRGADIAVSNKVPIRSDAIAALGRLKMIAIPATGYDIVDLSACRARGIIVSNVRGYAVNAVPEHVFALILALRRNLIGYRQDVIDGNWTKADQFCLFTHPISDLAGATLGIFGRGALGLGVARLGEAFGMQAVFAEHKGAEATRPHYAPFDEVLASADVISLNCPLLPNTANMIGLAEFGKMKRRPLLINCGRGGLVVEEDLVAALDEGLIAGAGFDCLSQEPPAADHPLMRIANRPNVIITPHVAWASDGAMQTLWDQCISHIDNFHAGTPSNVVG